MRFVSGMFLIFFCLQFFGQFQRNVYMRIDASFSNQKISKVVINETGSCSLLDKIITANKGMDAKPSFRNFHSSKTSPKVSFKDQLWRFLILLNLKGIAAKK